MGVIRRDFLKLSGIADCVTNKFSVFVYDLDTTKVHFRYESNGTQNCWQFSKKNFFGLLLHNTENLHWSANLTYDTLNATNKNYHQ